MNNEQNPVVGPAQRANDEQTSINPFAPIDGVQITELGIRLAPGTTLTPANYNALFRNVTALSRASNWLLGDTLELAERTWGNQATGSKYEEASKATGLTISTLKEIVYCCHAIPMESRRPGLSFSHHIEACKNTDTVTEREAMLDKAEKEGLTKRDLRRALRTAKAEKIKAEGDDTCPRDFAEEFCSDDDREAVKFPHSYEFALLRQWANREGVADKLPAEQRQRLLDCAQPLLGVLYRLLQLEEKSYSLPFPVIKA